MVKFLMLPLLLLTSFAHGADAPAWTLKPELSSITWQAMQNGAPVKGGFGEFTADIRFHPDMLGSSSATITIDTSSIHTSYDEAQNTLKTKDWFFTESFPEAVFETSSITPLEGENRFRAEGTLSIKDKRVPVTLDFLLHHMHDHEAHIIGEATLKRSDFGIGWADTAQIADEVSVMIEVKVGR